MGKQEGPAEIATQRSNHPKRGMFDPVPEHHNACPRPPSPWGNVTTRVGNYVTLIMQIVGNCVTADRPRWARKAHAEQSVDLPVVGQWEVRGRRLTQLARSATQRGSAPAAAQGAVTGVRPEP